MKLLNILLGLYFFMLLSAPCKDGQQNLFAEVYIAEQHTSTSSPHHHDGENCSPFCQCACCCTVVILRSSWRYSTPPILLVANANNAVVTFWPLSEYCGTVWQPPKMS